MESIPVFFQFWRNCFLNRLQLKFLSVSKYWGKIRSKNSHKFVSKTKSTNNKLGQNKREMRFYKENIKYRVIWSKKWLENYRQNMGRNNAAKPDEKYWVKIGRKLALFFKLEKLKLEIKNYKKIDIDQKYFYAVKMVPRNFEFSN